MYFLVYIIKFINNNVEEVIQSDRHVIIDFYMLD